MIPPVLEKSTPPLRGNREPLSDGLVRLNLGGIGDNANVTNESKIPGFLTVDLQDVPETDIICDISKLTSFGNESVDEIYCSNALEHFPHTQTLSVLKEWHRVLKPGSNLWVSVPDMDANLKLFQHHGLIPWVVNLIWGDQIHPYAFHYINFTFGSLAQLITDAGFSDVKRIVKMPFGIRDASEHRDNIHFERISLNVVAVK